MRRVTPFRPKGTTSAKRGSGVLGVCLSVYSVKKQIESYAHGNRNFSGVTLRLAELIGANLTCAELLEATLIGANLRQADLTDVDLSGAMLNEALC